MIIWFGVHCKKRLAIFPSPAGMSLNKLSLARESLVSDIPAGDGKTSKHIYSLLPSVLLQNVASRNVNVTFVTVTKHSCTQRRSHKTWELQNVSITYCNTYYCDVLTFFDFYVLELLRFETLTFRNYYVSDTTLSDINFVLCYVLSQYPSFALVSTIK